MRQRKSKPDTAAVRKGKPSGNVHVGAAMQLAKCVELNAPTETMPAIEAMQTRTEANSKELSIRAEDATTAGKAEVVNSFFSEASGVSNGELAHRIVEQVRILQECWPFEADRVEGLVAATEMIRGLKPENSIEAMLAVQMIGVHEAATRFLKEATVKGQYLDGADSSVMRATRLMRLFTEQLQAMAKLKGKGSQQKVTVEHVHVHTGGQAIVGEIRAEKSDER